MLNTMNDAERYDALLDEGRVPPMPCPICTGDPDAPPCGEECDALLRQAAKERLIRQLYKSCRRALRFARFYYRPGQRDQRVWDVVVKVGHYRSDIADLRAGLRGAS